MSTKPKGSPPQKTFDERLLSLSDWLRGRVGGAALPTTTMTMLRQRVERLNKWDHASRKTRNHEYPEP